MSAIVRAWTMHLEVSALHHILAIRSAFVSLRAAGCKGECGEYARQSSLMHANFSAMTPSGYPQLTSACARHVRLRTINVAGQAMRILPRVWSMERVEELGLA